MTGVQTCALPISIDVRAVEAPLARSRRFPLQRCIDVVHVSPNTAHSTRLRPDVRPDRGEVARWERRRRPHTPSRTDGAMGKFSRLLGVAATAATGFGMVQRKRMIDAVAPELRNRQLWMPLSLRGPRSLKVGRSMMAKQGVVAATCGVRADTATHGDGNPDRKSTRLNSSH